MWMILQKLCVNWQESFVKKCCPFEIYWKTSTGLDIVVVDTKV